MQLPRGTFRSIRKGVNFSDVLAELASSRFTGMCTISSATLNGTLVFRSGVCVLAKIQNFYGDKGWAALTEQPDQILDLAISDFNTAQIQLALDFNKNAMVHTATAPSPHKTAPPMAAVRTGERPSRESVKHASPPKKEQKKHEISNAPATSPAASAGTPPVHEERVTPVAAGGEIPAVPDTVPEKTSGSSDELDLEMFDKMDLDDVALKIRKDCKIILKQLQLDHLTEK
jgi:hypothetical protein